jgi:glycerophosphoryl diester phosphodiesterase
LPFHPLAAESGFVHVCAHRGHSVDHPENTLPAIEAAARNGATVCEIDIVLTGDDEIILLHDEFLDRTTDGTGRAAARSLSEIRALDAGSWLDPRFAGVRVPTLAEALESARSLNLGLLVEIKERQRPGLLIEMLGRVLREQGALEDVLVISFDHPSLVMARERIPGLRTELITHARHVDPVSIACRAGAASVAIEWDMFHPDDAVALHEAGIATRVTIPRPDRIAMRRRHGLDLEEGLLAALGAGLIDVLAGDDAGHVATLVRRAAAPQT